MKLTLSAGTIINSLRDDLYLMLLNSVANPSASQ